MKGLIAIAGLIGLTAAQEIAIPVREEPLITIVDEELPQKEPLLQNQSENQIDILEKEEDKLAALKEEEHERRVKDKKKSHKKDKHHNHKKEKGERHGLKREEDETLPPYEDYEAWNDRIDKHEKQGKHRKHGKHGKGLIHLALFGFIFILVGLFVGKCVKKCKKNSRKRCEKRRRSMWTSQQVEEEISRKQQELRALTHEYQSKREQESLNRKPGHANLQLNQRRVCQFIEEQPMRVNSEYSQNYPRYQQYGHEEEIPMGKPINESEPSSSFSSYPRL